MKMGENIHDANGFMKGFCVTTNLMMFMMSNNSFKQLTKHDFSGIFLMILESHFYKKFDRL
jgi:hypothetical protein